MIKIICVGKMKEAYLKDAQEEYLKRLQKFDNVSIIEVEDEKTDNEKIAIKKEKERILKVINNKDYIITLEITANQMSSSKLATKIEMIYQINSNITFIIGGSCGLDEEIKSLANYHLSFSELTFPHQLFRIMLLEQIYRCFKINHNEKYHK